MDIVYNLKKFLNEQQDEAAIPGLGVFYKSLTDSQGNDLPDGKNTILFKEKNPRSNAFVNYLGYENNLTENEANLFVENWVTAIISKLNSEKKCEIPELGTFKIQGTSVIFLTECVEDSPTEYGLEENPSPVAPVKEIKKQEPQKKKKMPAKKNTPSGGLSKSALIWLIVCASVIVLAGAAVVCYKTMPSFQYYTQKTYHKLKTSTWFKAEKVEPIVLMPAETTPELPPVEDIPEVTTGPEEKVMSTQSPSVPTNSPKEQKQTPSQKNKVETKSVPEKTSTIKAESPKSGSFYVVAGSFSIKANADKFAQEMKKEGYSAQAIFDETKKLYLVSIGRYASMNDALTFKETIRSTKDIACWIYKK